MDEGIVDTLVSVGNGGRLADSDHISNSHRVIDRGLRPAAVWIVVDSSGGRAAISPCYLRPLGG